MQPNDALLNIGGSAFSQPYGVASDAAGNVYVADDVHTSIVRIAPSGTTINIGAGFNTPRAVAVDAGGNVYVADSQNNNVWMVSPPFTGATHGTMHRVGSGFNQPNGVAVSATCSANCPVFVADTFDNVVERIDPPFTGTSFGTHHPVGSGFSLPTGVATDAGGNAYVADHGNHKVWKVTLPFSGTTHGTLSQVGTGFSGPWGVAVDATGNVLVANPGVHYVSKIAPPFTGITFGTITHIGGSSIGSPRAAVQGASGYVYVADRGNAMVERVILCNLCFRLFVKNGGTAASRPNSVKLSLRDSTGTVTNFPAFTIALSNLSCASGELGAFGPYGVFCYEGLNVAPNFYTATFSTYNSPNGTGAALSANEGMVVSTGTTPAVDLYDAAPWTYRITAAPGSFIPTSGIQKCAVAPQTMLVNGVELYGGYVLGAGTPPQSLTSTYPAVVSVAPSPSIAVNAFTVTPHIVTDAQNVELDLRVSPSESAQYYVSLLGGTQICGVATQYSIGSTPLGITYANDGNMYAILKSGKIVRVGSNGPTAVFSSGIPPVGVGGGRFANITYGPDGALWYVADWDNVVGRMTLTGTTTLYPIPTANSRPAGITSAGGNLFFTESAESASKIGKITLAGAITEYATPTKGSQPDYIVNSYPNYGTKMWFTEEHGARIGEINTAGSISEFPLPNAVTPSPVGIGGYYTSVGALIFTESGFTSGQTKIGFVSSTGTITEHAFSSTVQPYTIMLGPDGNYWFNASDGKLYRVTPGGVVSQPFTLPAAAAPAALGFDHEGVIWYGGSTTLLQLK